MDRPFSAFTALMSLLALSMFAVSSTTRSTTVQATAKRTRAAVQRLPARTATMAMPNRQAKVSLPETAAIDLANVELRMLPLTVRGPAVRLTAARVLISDCAAGMSQVAAMDGQTEYDPLYDHVIYGGMVVPAASTAAQNASEPASVLSDADTIDMFHDLLGQTTERRGKQPATRDALPIRWRGLLAAIDGWLKYQLTAIQRPTRGNAPLAGQYVGWSDYAEFADGLDRVPAATAVAASAWDGKTTVRSGGCLRHSAVAGLYQMSSVLRAAAIELEKPVSPTSGGVSVANKP